MLQTLFKLKFIMSTIKQAKKWIKDNGFLIKNITIQLDKPLLGKEDYRKRYKRSRGTVMSSGYCLFYDIMSSLNQKKSTGTLYPMSKEVSEEILSIINMPLGTK